MEITAEQALEIVHHAVRKAHEIKVPVNIAVMDTGGHLKLFYRMEDAYVGSIDIAIGKARTSMLFRMNSEGVGKFLDPEKRTFGMVNTNGGLVAFPGGMPVLRQEQVVAYIGVSGGSLEEDFAIATAGSAG